MLSAWEFTLDKGHQSAAPSRLPLLSARLDAPGALYRVHSAQVGKASGRESRKLTKARYEVGKISGMKAG